MDGGGGGGKGGGGLCVGVSRDNFEFVTQSVT